MGNNDHNKDEAGVSSHPEDALSNAKKRELEKELSVERDDASSATDDRDATDNADDDKMSKADEPHEPDTSEERSDPGEAEDDEAESDGKNEHGNHQHPGRLKRFFRGYWRKKAWTVPLTLTIVITGAAFGVPWSRYLILGQYIERPYTVELVDAKTQKPVSSAQVAIGGVQATTDAKGRATVHAKVGPANLTVDKKYYQTLTETVFVGLAAQKGADHIELTATGRQVPIAVVNKVSGKPLADATVKAVGTEIKTDKEGKAVIVLPADQPTLSGTVSAKGFNDLKVTVQVTESVVKENTFAVVPVGKVYFLSRLSGKVDVVKTDLDGANRQTVIAGTGKEEEGGTVLLASRDWKYLALWSKRDSGLPKLYLIDTDTDKMTVMDEGNASFLLSGWSNHNFVYSLTRNGVNSWEPNRQAVKSYDAEKKRILTIDQNEAEGVQSDYIVQAFENFTLVRDKLVYTTRWSRYNAYYTSYRNLDGKNSIIREATIGTTTKKDLKSFPATQYYYISATQYAPTEVYFELGSSNPKPDYMEYDDGQIKDASEADIQKAQTDYHTYLASPSGSKTFWTEQRDGRDTFFVGDAAGNNAKQVAVLDEYQVYGWYTDDYLLVSKKGSELYILPVSGGTPLKVTDYHKPQISYRGYGGGYGGL